jgi:hypothetical protein
VEPGPPVGADDAPQPLLGSEVARRFAIEERAVRCLEVQERRAIADEQAVLAVWHLVRRADAPLGARPRCGQVAPLGLPGQPLERTARHRCRCHHLEPVEVLRLPAEQPCYETTGEAPVEECLLGIPPCPDPGWPRRIQGHLAVHDRPAVSCADESHPGIDELVPVKHRRKVGDATLPAVHISLPPVEWLFFLFSVQDRNLAIPDRLRRCLAFTVIARLDHLQMILLWWYSLVHATWKPVSETRYHCRS